MAPRTVKRETARLAKSGFIRSTKTKGGNRYEILDPIFSDDTYRGRRDKISSTAKTYVSWSAITADIADEPFHLLLLLESIGKGHEWAKPGQGLLASFFHSRKSGRDNITVRTIHNWATDLADAGLVEMKRPDEWAQNWYRLHKELVAHPDRQDRTVPILALPGTAKAVAEKYAEDSHQSAEGVLDDVEAEASPSVDVLPEARTPAHQGSKSKLPGPDTGMGLARHFASHFKGSADPVNVTALASVLNRWKGCRVGTSGSQAGRGESARGEGGLNDHQRDIQAGVPGCAVLRGCVPRR